MLSVDGRCKTWDARANGYVRSEGVGCTVVALGGERAAGVGLLGVAVRQDGRSASLTAPNGSAQRALLQAALVSAGVAAAAVARLEAHGTGTALGDPTEAGALGATLLQGRGEAHAPLVVGAAKASIGHGEAASGQSGLQRLAAALGRLAAGGNAQLRRLNPLVGELWKGAAVTLGAQPVRAICGYCPHVTLALILDHDCNPGSTPRAGAGGQRRRWARGRRVILWVQRHDCARAAAGRAGWCGVVCRGKRHAALLPSARLLVGLTGATHVYHRRGSSRHPILGLGLREVCHECRMGAAALPVRALLSAGAPRGQGDAAAGHVLH
jgi:hypothetical protein